MPGILLGVKFQGDVFLGGSQYEAPLDPLSCILRLTPLGLSDRFREHLRALEKAITQRDIDQPITISDQFTLSGHLLNLIIIIIIIIMMMMMMMMKMMMMMMMMLMMIIIMKINLYSAFSTRFKGAVYKN